MWEFYLQILRQALLTQSAILYIETSYIKKLGPKISTLIRVIKISLSRIQVLDHFLPLDVVSEFHVARQQ